MDGSNFDVYGWSAGVLLRFGIRDGRLCRWTQRACGHSRAAPLLAATPADWTDFTRPNAELAAALARCAA